jgi:hypothetical protein
MTLALKKTEIKRMSGVGTPKGQPHRDGIFKTGLDCSLSRSCPSPCCARIA